MLANKFKPLITAFLMLAASPLAQAFTYSDTQLLLIFRKDSYPDVEFNLGTVSNYLGRAQGTVLIVTNWNSTLVTSNFDGDLTGVKFILAAVGADDISGQLIPRHAWLTDGNSVNTPTDVSGSKLGTIWTKINFLGNQAQIFTATNSSLVYAVDATDSSSYTYVASEGGHSDISTIAGTVPFPVEGEIPGTNRFFELKVSNVVSKPAATQIGSFGIDGESVLRFTAGAPISLSAPTDVVISKTTGGVTVTFNTVTGVNYRLVYCDALTVPLSWTVLSPAGTVAGNGSSKTLQDTAGNAHRFYRVEVFQ
jgi:hypothetical protein